jgi:hypothetical protein
MKKITQVKLKELLNYDPETGIFNWIIERPGVRKKRTGWLDKKGYLFIRIYGVLYCAHRLAWLYMTGEWPNGEIDHKDSNPPNNRWENLRDATHSVNQQNRRKASHNNKTGFIGVRPMRKSFHAQMSLHGKSHYIGAFQTAELAYEAYLKAKRELHEGCTI